MDMVTRRPPWCCHYQRQWSLGSGLVMMAVEAVEFHGFGAVFGRRRRETCKWISSVE